MIEVFVHFFQVSQSLQQNQSFVLHIMQLGSQMYNIASYSQV